MQTMIENEDMATTPRPIAQNTIITSSTTIQVPAKQETPIPTANPFIKVDDLLALKVVSDPQISPDGSLIAFTVQSNEETNTTSSSIWLIHSKDSKAQTPRQLTGTGTQKHHDFAPRWSPDGQFLAFLSDRNGTAQIHLLPLAGGETQQLSNLKQGITEYSWRPDGKAFSAHSAWKPIDDLNQPETSNISVEYTRLDEQVDGLGYKQRRHQQLWLILLDGASSRLTSEQVDIIQSCWSPDGSEIAFCANRRSDPDLSVSMALWVLSISTGHMRCLTPEDGLATMPSWSPDGQTIAYYYSKDQTETSNLSPCIVNAHDNSSPRSATSSAVNLTCFELIVDELHFTVIGRPLWFPDSKSLLITVQERGQIHLYRLDIEHDQTMKLTSGNGCYINPQLSKDGQIIAMVRTDWFTPGDVWRMDNNGENGHKLTGVNDTFLRGHQLVRPKRLSWQSFDGLEIEAWLYLPPLQQGVKAPLILEIHGGPSRAWGDSYVQEFQVLAGKGYAILAANPRGSIGYGEEFCKQTLKDWGGKDFQDLMAGLDHVLATEPVDGTRLGIGGLSYGGYMTNWAITQTNRFKAAVSRNGISSLISAGLLSDQTLWFEYVMGSIESQEDEAFLKSRSALTFADRITTPLLLLHADNDLRCAFSESYQLFVMLRKRKHTVELVRYSGVSHLIDFPDYGSPEQRVDRLRRTIEWFERFV
ncbi:MAG TPA: S9 family peptidase [Ktedonobacteraceae bacterium]|nr:S9 family peptidase [Ktedonobacteraceae bacterium]